MLPMAISGGGWAFDDDGPTTVDRTPTTAPHDLRDLAARHEGREDVFRALYAVLRRHAHKTGMTAGEMDVLVVAVRQQLMRR